MINLINQVLLAWGHGYKPCQLMYPDSLALLAPMIKTTDHSRCCVGDDVGWR